MVEIPTKFSSSIRQIVEWHKDSFMVDEIFSTRLNRILEHFFERKLVNGTVQIEEKELWFLKECISDATNNIEECGIEKNAVWEIYDWIIAECEKHNV